MYSLAETVAQWQAGHVEPGLEPYVAAALENPALHSLHSGPPCCINIFCPPLGRYLFLSQSYRTVLGLVLEDLPEDPRTVFVARTDAWDLDNAVTLARQHYERFLAMTPAQRLGLVRRYVYRFQTVHHGQQWMLEQLIAIRLTPENRMEWVLGVMQPIPDPSQDAHYTAYIDQLVDIPPVRLYFDPSRLDIQLGRQEVVLLRLAAQGLPPSRIAQRMGLTFGEFVRVAQDLLGRTGRSSLVEILEAGRSAFPVMG